MSRAKKAAPGRNRKKQRRQNNKLQLRAAFKWFCNGLNFDNLVLHGNTNWKAPHLIVLTFLWIWSEKKNLTGAFEEAAANSQSILGCVAVLSYQGLLRALTTWTPEFIPRIQERIHDCMEQIAGKHFRIGRWAAIAMDGSRTTVPRTKSNEKAFCAPNYGKGKTAKYRKNRKNKKKKHRKNECQLTPPQVWLTMMWHIALGVPWTWKLGPSTASERDHVKELVATGDFPENTLFVGDAGFVGYELWKAILDRGHHFMVRVGGNVHLLKNLGGCQAARRKEIVYCWPAMAIKSNLPPMKLRLVKCKVGKATVYLLTSVLDEAQLTRKEMARLYELRWGIELEFRSLKQTFDRRKLRCRNSDRALVELEWSIAGMAIIELFTLKEQFAQKKQKVDPGKVSFAMSLHAVRQSLNCLTNRPAHVSDLCTLLNEAVIDDYERKSSKAARYRPKRNHPPKCCAPKLKPANEKQRKKYRELELKTAI
jgi:hypothetical protein